MSQHSDIYRDALITSLAGTADSRTPASELAAQAAKIALYCEYEHAQHNESKTHIGGWLVQLIRALGIGCDVEVLTEDVVASARAKIRELHKIADAARLVEVMEEAIPKHANGLLLRWGRKLGIDVDVSVREYARVHEDVLVRLDELVALECAQASQASQAEAEVEARDELPPRRGFYYLGWGPVVLVDKSGVHWHDSLNTTPASAINDWGPRIPDYDHAKHAGMQLAWVEPELIELKTCAGAELDALARKSDAEFTGSES